MQKKIYNKNIPLWARPIRMLYRASKLAVRGSHLREVERGGIRYLVWTNEDIGKKLIILRSYEAAETAYIKSVVKSGDVCLDVGGNVGYFSLNLAACCYPGKVHVFEPIERNVLVIRLASIINGFDNVDVVECAVSDKAGEVELTIPSEDSAYAFISTLKGKKGKSTKTVRTDTLDAFVKERSIKKVAFLKVDVEGAEHLVLDGARALLSDRKARPKAVMAELVNEFLARFDSSIEKIIAYMAGFGYKPFFASKNGTLLPYAKEHEDNVFNIFFVCE